MPFPRYRPLTQFNFPTLRQEDKCRTPAKIVAPGLTASLTLPCPPELTAKARNALEPISTGTDIEFRTRFD